MKDTEKKLIVYSERRGSEYKKFEINVGAIYFIQPKIDMNAPDGFIREGTGRLPNPVDGAKIINLVPADPNKSSESTTSLEGKYYDTGMTEHSYNLQQALSALDKSAMTEQLKVIQELIVEPVERIFGEGALNPRNVDFWSGVQGSAKIFVGKIFDTSDPIQLMQLYLLALNGIIAPKEFEKRSLYVESNFIFDNEEETRDIRTKSTVEKAKAQSRFFTVNSKKNTDSSYLLEYAGIRNIAGFDGKDELIVTFEDWINKEPQNVTLFNKVYENLFESQLGKDTFVIFKQVIELIKKKKLEKLGGTYYLEDIELGTTPKEIARTILSNLDNKKKFAEFQKEVTDKK